jgi:hypothetical protein
MCFACKEKDHNIAICPKEEASKQICQNRTVRFGKSEYPVLTENFRTSGKCNKGFKVALNKYMGRNESAKRQSKNKASRIKHQICYTCRDKCHLSKDCPKTQTFIDKLIKVNLSHVESKNDTRITKMISSSYNSPRVIWVPKHLLTNHEGPNKAWVLKFTWLSCRWIEMHWNLGNQRKDDINCYIIKSMNHYINIDPL